MAPIRKKPVRPEDLARFSRSLKDRGFAGCNVTVPHKEAAFAAAEIKSPSAIAVGAANTLWLEGDALACENTDTYGFMANLDQSAPHWQDSRRRPIMILGAGGSARAVIHGFLEAGRDDIRIFNRTVERGQRSARHFGARFPAWPWDARNDHTAEASRHR